MIKCKKCGNPNITFDPVCIHCATEFDLNEKEAKLLLDEAADCMRKKRYDEAVDLYKFLGGVGVTEGERVFAFILERGVLVPRDLDMAMQYYYAAAKKENPSLTYADFTSAHMRTLYNWILNNKDSKNIQYVLGLGDITQSFNTTQTYYNDEWPLAKEALSLLDGKLGYSLVRGNHDISSGLNAQFGVGTAYYNTLMALAATNDAEGRPMAAFRDATKIEDSYRKIVTSNGDKYIIYTLEYYPTEETVAWLNETLSANSDYTAIVTLHAFLNRDATFVSEFETTTPAEEETTAPVGETTELPVGETNNGTSKSTGGCGSALGGALALFALIGAAGVGLCKKKD